jgi:hypothetical protein
MGSDPVSVSIHFTYIQYTRKMNSGTVYSFLRALPLLLLLISLPVTADHPIEVIQLKSHLLDEILPVNSPLIGEDATATGRGDKLVLKAAPEKDREIRKLLLEIDRPPRRLLITVSTQGDSMQGSSGFSAGADIKTGDRQIRINAPKHGGDDTRVYARIHDSNGRRSLSSGQKVTGPGGASSLYSQRYKHPVS